MLSTKFSDARFWLVLGLVGGLAVAAFAKSAAAQGKNYYVAKIEDVYQEDGEKHKELKGVKARVLNGAVPFSAEYKQQFDEWYKNYFFRSFTQPNQLGQLALKRQELAGELARSGFRDNTKAVHDYLLQQTLGFMNVYVRDSDRYEFHPAVRFNAMLVIGELNSAERGTERRFPLPYAPALDIMLTELQNPKQIDAVRVAALIGIMRHVKLQHYDANPAIPAPKRNAIAQEMLALLAAEPPADRSPSGHVWMQRRAVETLGALGLIGESDTVNTAIASIVADSNADLLLRCTAARTLVLLNPAGNAPIDPADMSTKLGALAAQGVRDDLAWIDELKLAKEAKKNAGMYGQGMMMSGGYGGEYEEYGADYEEDAYDSYSMEMDEMGGMMGEYGMMGGMMSGGYGMAAPKDPELDMARRRLKYKLVCVKDGLAKVAGAAQGNGQAANILRRVDALMAATDPPENEPTLDALARELRKAVRDLEVLTKSAAPAPVVPAAGSQSIDDAPGALSRVPSDAPRPAARKSPAGKTSGKAAPGKNAPKKNAPKKNAPAKKAPAKK